MTCCSRIVSRLISALTESAPEATARWFSSSLSASMTRFTSSLSLHGFSTKSKAPFLSADTAMGTSPWPVRKITGSLQPRSPSRSKSSGPLMPSMRMSSTMQPVSERFQRARKSSAEG